MTLTLAAETSLPRQRLKASLVTPERVFAVGAGVYLLLSLLAYLVARPTMQLYFADYWEHRAIIGEVMRHGTRLADPIYGEAATSRQFTPWSLALGYLARVAHLNVDTAMAIGALAVAVLFAVGVHAFAKRYYAHRWAPAVLLASVTCAWGLPPLIWTGFHSLRSQMHGDYYPASLVFALTFIAWAQVVALLRAPRVGGGEAARAAMLIAVITISLVTHPLNAVFLLAGAGALTLVEPGIAPRRRMALAAVLVAGVLASAPWPYFNPLSLAGAGLARGQATFNNFAFFYRPLFVAALMGPASLALIAAWSQLRDSRRRVPVLAFLCIAAAYVAGGIADISVAHRLLAYVALALQMMLVWVVLDAIDARPPAPLTGVSRRSWRIAGHAALAVIVAQVALAAQQLVHPWSMASPYPLHPVDAEVRRVVAALPPGARVLGWDSAALVLPAYGVKVVAFPRPMPLSPSDARRQADERRFFGLGTPGCERRAIAARWGATHVAYLTHEVAPALRRRLLRDLGPATSPVEPWRIIPAPPLCRGFERARAAANPL